MKFLKKIAISILEKHPYDYALGLKIMESSAFFLPHESDFYAMPLVSNARKGLFLDVGANRGHSALGFKKIMPDWQTISVEANPLHSNRLHYLKTSQKISDYHIIAADSSSGNTVTIWTPRYKRIHCHSSAAIDKTEAIRSIEMSFPAQANDFNYIETRTKTLALDELGLKPDIVKIDIQGKEIDSIRGLAKTISAHRPSFLIECNLVGDNVIAYMQKLDYVPYLYERRNHRLVTIPPNIDFTNGRNVFFIPSEKLTLLSLN